MMLIEEYPTVMLYRNGAFIKPYPHQLAASVLHRWLRHQAAPVMPTVAGLPGLAAAVAAAAEAGRAVAAQLLPAAAEPRRHRRDGQRPAGCRAAGPARLRRFRGGEWAAGHHRRGVGRRDGGAGRVRGAARGRGLPRGGGGGGRVFGGAASVLPRGGAAGGAAGGRGHGGSVAFGLGVRSRRPAARADHRPQRRPVPTPPPRSSPHASAGGGQALAETSSNQRRARAHALVVQGEAGRWRWEVQKESAGIRAVSARG